MSLIDPGFGEAAMKNSDSLGRSIIKSRKGKKIANNTSQLHNTTVADGPEWSKLGSITEQNDLDDLMTVAHLAGKEFTAERGTAAFVQSTQEKDAATAERVYAIPSDETAQSWIRIPRKPRWDKNMDRDELHRLEQESFLEWRRQLAKIEEADHFILTPFERNLDIWRQLWRVVELSDIVIQIVDARNPEVFFCADLFEYTKSIDSEKSCLLLLNKADLLTDAQRDMWAAHLRSKGLSFLFFSALAADEEEDEEDEGSTIPRTRNVPEISGSRVLSRTELLDYLAEYWGSKTVGLVGYPNVGKSSTINALMGEKKVAVAITPGKTKHYQTLFLGNGVKICDCPGLVFPNFSVSKSDLVLNGILPVDQLRDWISPTTLLSERVPRDVIERLYGIMLPLPGFEEDPERRPTAAEILCTFAIARGFRTSNFGNPDQSRASRIILKDYVAGKLLFSHAPSGKDQSEYSQMTYDVLRTTLPVRSQPKPHKPSTGIEDEHILSSSIGFTTKKPGDKAAFSNSKKHFKGKR